MVVSARHSSEIRGSDWLFQGLPVLFLLGMIDNELYFLDYLAFVLRILQVSLISDNIRNLLALCWGKILDFRLELFDLVAENAFA